MTFEKGKPCIIDKFEISGNSKTKQYVIERALQIKSGDEYSQEKIDKIPEQLNKLRFFKSIREPSFFLNSKDEGIIKISLEEEQTNNFDGIIGYIPSNNEGQKGYFTGFFNISFRNLFGTGRAASLKWERFDRSSESL